MKHLESIRVWNAILPKTSPTPNDKIGLHSAVLQCDEDFPKQHAQTTKVLRVKPCQTQLGPIRFHENEHMSSVNVSTKMNRQLPF